MKQFVPNNLLAHEDGALLAILLIIRNQLTKYEASIYNIFTYPLYKFAIVFMKHYAPTICLTMRMELF